MVRPEEHSGPASRRKVTPLKPLENIYRAAKTSPSLQSNPSLRVEVEVGEGDDEEAPSPLFPLFGSPSNVWRIKMSWRAIDILSHGNGILIEGLGQDDRQEILVAFTELVTRLPAAIPILLQLGTNPAKEELDVAVPLRQIQRARADLTGTPGQPELASTASSLTLHKFMNPTSTFPEQTVMKAACEAQFKLQQDQISILLNHNKKLEETQQTPVREKNPLTTEMEKLKADALNLREWQEKKDTLQDKGEALEAEVQGLKVAAAEDIEILVIKNKLLELDEKKLEREAKSTPSQSPERKRVKMECPTEP